MTVLRRLAVPALAAFVFAMSPAPGGGSARAGEGAPQRMVSVSGIGTVLRAPDRASVTLGVEHARKTAPEAMKAVSAATRAVIEALTRVGVPEAGIATIGVSLGPVYRHVRRDNGDGETVLTGFRAANQLRVTIDDFASLGPAIGAAAAAGSNAISSVTFENSGEADARDEARRLAVANARDKAATMAEVAGARLGKVLTMSEMQDVRGGPARMEMARAAVADMAPPIAAGERAITVRVTATWALVD